MLDMKRNTGAKVSALIGSTLALGTIFGLVSRNAPQTVADTSAPEAAAPPQQPVAPTPARAAQQPVATPPARAAQQPATQARPSPTAAAQVPVAPTPAPPPKVVKTKHTRTRSS